MTEKNNMEGLNESARLAKELAMKRMQIEGDHAQILKAEEDLKETGIYKAIEMLRLDMENLIEETRGIEKELRSTALDVAIELQTKKPAPGITVTKRTLFVIENDAAALEACRESYPQLIEEKIKKTELKKIVVTLGEAIEGTTLTIEEFGQVKIATNLADYYLPVVGNNADVPF